MTDELVRAELLRGRPEAARSRIERFLTDVDATTVGALDRPFVRYTLLSASGQLAAMDLLDQIEAAYTPDQNLDHKNAELWIHHGDAARALAEGRPERALTALRDLDAFGFNGSFIRPAADLAFAQTFDALAEVDSAIAYFETFVHPVHVARDNSVRSYLPTVVRRLAELEESRGNTDAAIEHYRRFLELWSDADPELRDQVTSVQRALSRLTVAES